MWTAAGWRVKSPGQFGQEIDLAARPKSGNSIGINLWNGLLAARFFFLPWDLFSVRRSLA
jgi:hypothetical protein